VLLRENDRATSGWRDRVIRSLPVDPPLAVGAGDLYRGIRAGDPTTLALIAFRDERFEIDPGLSVPRSVRDHARMRWLIPSHPERTAAWRVQQPARRLDRRRTAMSQKKRKKSAALSPLAAASTLDGPFYCYYGRRVEGTCYRLPVS